MSVMMSTPQAVMSSQRMMPGSQGNFQGQNPFSSGNTLPGSGIMRSGILPGTGSTLSMPGSTVMIPGSKVYGVPVSPVAYMPAQSFMHAQTGILGLKICDGCMSLILSVVMWSYLKDSVHLFPDVGDGNTKTDGAGSSFLTREVSSDWRWGEYLWISALMEVVVSFCAGTALVIGGRLIIERRSTGALQFCMVSEGICACYHCLQACWGCCAVFTAMSAMAAFHDPMWYCNNSTQKMGVDDTTGQTITLTTTQGLMSDPTYSNCITVIESFKSAAYIYMVFALFATCFGLIVASVCGSGAKFADDTAKAFEEEEFGPLPYEGEALYNNDNYNDDYY